jgi:hypothetical protein
MPIEAGRLQAQTMVLQWVQARIQDIGININNNNESKDPKILL